MHDIDTMLNNNIVEQYNNEYGNRLYGSVIEIWTKCNDQILIM